MQDPLLNSPHASMSDEGEYLINEVMGQIREAEAVKQQCENIDLLTDALRPFLEAFIGKANVRFKGNLEHVKEVAKLSRLLSSQAEQMSIVKSNQSDQLAQVLEDISSLSSAIEHSFAIAQFTAETAESSAESVQKGQNTVRQFVNKIKEVEEVFTKTKGAMEDLDDSSQSIGKIISVIEAIASQTNLLSLNAAIEAARAGDQGKGFAVVASEVRALAKQTSEATKQIEVLVKTIQEQVGIALAYTQEGESKVNEENVYIDKTTQDLDEILDASIQTQSLVLQIASSSEEQTGINKGLINTLDKIVEEKAGAIENMQGILNIADEITATANLLNWALAQLTEGAHIEDVFEDAEAK